MTPERWRQVTDLFEAALDRQPAERSGFLRNLCAGDEELWREVNSLLGELQQAEGFLNKLGGPGICRLTQAIHESVENLSPDQQFVGRALGHYLVLDKLGEGGMGLVYKARDTRLDRLVAIKMLRLAHVADAERKQRFLQEAKSASALNHPNIITIHDTASEDEIDFIVMEYVAGMTLDRLISVTGLQLNEALDYAIQMAEALITAHAASIVHRDFKPSNVMVSESGLVKVLDFGLAKLAERAGHEASYQVPLPWTHGGLHTQEGVILGTDAYMSPEQAEGKRADARSDIFSFGSVLYEMVTGQKAFQGDSRTSTRTAIINRNPRPITEISPAVPRDLQNIISRCLEKSAGARWQSMTDVKGALQTLRTDLEAGRLARARAASRSIGRSWLWAGAALVLLATAALWLYHEGPRKPAAAPEVVPLTSYVGTELSSSFYPDGNQVAFSWDGEKQDNMDIYVKAIGSPTPLRLTTDPADDLSPAYSPDGAWIGFLRMAKDRIAFVIVPSIGGPEHLVAEVPNLGILFTEPSFSWFPDGKWVATDGLRLISVETGQIRRLTSAPRTLQFDISPAVSPDGHTIAFTRGASTAWNIFLLDLSEDLKPKREPRRLTFLKTDSYSPVWTTHGDEIIFASGDFYRGSLWRLRASGQSEPIQLPFNIGEASWPAISRSGRQLSYRRSLPDKNIWRLPLSGAGVAAGPPVPIIDSTRIDYSPQYSPDGRRIVFNSDRSGSFGIWVSDANGSNPVELFCPTGRFCGSPSWSPDGQRVAFDSVVDDNVDIYIIPASGGNPFRLTTDSSLDVVPSWSRDGNWIYFVSRRTGRWEVWKAPSGGGEATQVTTNGGFAALESPDGKSIYYTKGLSEASMALERMSLQDGQVSRVLPSVVFRAFALVDNGIYFIPEAPGQSSGEPKSLSLLSSCRWRDSEIEWNTCHRYPVSPDQRYLFIPRTIRRLAI